MPLGPVELVVLSFPGERAGPEVRQALLDVIERGCVKLLDLVFVTKAADGAVTVLEVEEAGELGFDLTVEHVDLVSGEDTDDIASGLDPGKSAAVLVFEHAWATNLVQAIRNVGGELELDVRIPAEDADSAMAAVAS
jgi:hypothetical protein